VPRGERLGRRPGSRVLVSVDDDGRPVANGVYFFRVETDAGDRAFGNLVVLD